MLAKIAYYCMKFLTPKFSMLEMPFFVKNLDVAEVSAGEIGAFLSSTHT